MRCIGVSRLCLGAPGPDNAWRPVYESATDCFCIFAWYSGDQLHGIDFFSEHRVHVSIECDNDNGKWYKYVCITTDKPDTKSNPNLTLTVTPQQARNSEQ